MTKSTITVYGIRNCDTVKKARLWLTDHGEEHVFHDYKVSGVPVPQIDRWLNTIAWDSLLNRKGTMWRKLDDATRAAVVDAASARAVMLAQPSTIKRPVVDWDGQSGANVSVGFKPEAWLARLKIAG